MSIKMDKTEIFCNVDFTLETAEMGFKDLISRDLSKKSYGLRNLVVFGRAVTNVLQKLRSVEPSFDNWYDNYQKEMRSDPLLKYFYELRSTILKEGLINAYPSLNIKHFTPGDLGKAPPNAKGFFIFDKYGGCGWNIELADGTIEKYYVELPLETATSALIVENPPRQHLGNEIQDTSVENLSKLYLVYLKELVKSAKMKFS
jgi:hypothetical protein